LLLLAGCSSLPDTASSDAGAGDAGAVDAAAVSCPPGGGSVLSAVSITVPPAPNQMFAVGDAPALTIRFSDRCDRPLSLGQLGTASLFLYGPRAATHTKTASKLLNCVTDPQAKDHQHHFINLLAPSYADPARGGLTLHPDGSVTYQLGAISDEEPGTYTVGVLAKSADDTAQVFALAELQLRTPTVETFASGPVDTSSCGDCHRGAASGKLNMLHSFPGRSPLGDWAIDLSPVGTCKACHNLAGLSPNPLLRKVHGVHRGKGLASPGVAHPEYGLGFDDSLADYTNVEFPAMPDGEKDCTKCHRDDRWAQLPSRLACGSCHDHVFFDTGKIDPPTPLGKPAAGACKADPDCVSFGPLASCNVAAGSCQLSRHSVQRDDSACRGCHTADSSGLAPIRLVHQIAGRTLTPGLKLSGLTVTGGSGKNGTVVVGDTPSVSFKLQDRTGASIKDLLTNRAYAGTVLVAGPTDDRQRVYGPLPLSGAGLTYDAGADRYSFVLPTPFPAKASLPLNAEPAAVARPNPAGTYTAWVYVTTSVSTGAGSVRDSGGALADFAFSDDKLAARPRQVILQSACDSCHVSLQAHGGTRRQAEGCSMCHTQGAQDNLAGALGSRCLADADCGGAAAGWESCIDTNADGKPDTCALSKDPTPGQTIYFPALIHGIHFGRKLGGYAERNNLIDPGSLVIVGYNNRVSNLSTGLFPQDIRNCQKCHADSGAACGRSTPCGVGQGCSAGVCRNLAWQKPSGKVCVSCHDTAEASAHAALNTYHEANGTVTETCDVCHGSDAEFSVARVHNIASPYRPPYSRDRSR
jgi:hypothetical protein